MQMILMVVGTILSLLFIVQLQRSGRYSGLLEKVDEKAFPLHELYGVGCLWNEVPLFALRGKARSRLRSYAHLLYDAQYVDFYSYMAWVQMLTFVHLLLSVTFLLSGAMYQAAVLYLPAGLFAAALLGVNSMEEMKNAVSKRTAECEKQLPDAVSTIAVLVNSGLILREAWREVSRGEGALYELMRRALVHMDNGVSDADAIFLFGQMSNSAEVKKFSNALLQNLEKGGGEITAFLMQQSAELWSQKKQLCLQEGSKAATKLLGPIVLIFVGILLIILVGAFTGVLN